MVMDLRMLVHMNAEENGWEIPVLSTQAHTNVGIVELYEAIEQHRQMLQDSGQLEQRRRENRRRELVELLQHRILVSLQERLDKDESLLALVDQVQEASLDPYTAAHRILQGRATP
jgi:LAO/AO transport system kinase